MKVNIDNMRRIHTGDLNKLGRCLKEVEDWRKNTSEGCHSDIDDLLEELKKYFNQVAKNQNVTNLLSLEGGGTFNRLPDDVSVLFLISAEQDQATAANKPNKNHH